MASSVVTVDPHFDAFAELLQTWHATVEQAYAAGDRAVWLRPEGVGPPDDYPGMQRPFDRSQVTAQGQKALSGEGGVTGDLVAANVQIEYLAVACRAYLDWQTDGPLRAFAHTAAQAHALGLPDGPVGAAARDYVNRVLAAAAAGG